MLDALHAAVLQTLEAATTGGGGGGTVLYVDAGAAEALHGSAPLRTLMQRGFSAVLPLADAHAGRLAPRIRVALRPLPSCRMAAASRTLTDLKH
jgi:hypothetical protein